MRIWSSACLVLGLACGCSGTNSTGSGDEEPNPLAPKGDWNAPTSDAAVPHVPEFDPRDNVVAVGQPLSLDPSAFRSEVFSGVVTSHVERGWNPVQIETRPVQFAADEALPFSVRVDATGFFDSDARVFRLFAGVAGTGEMEEIEPYRATDGVITAWTRVALEDDAFRGEVYEATGARWTHEVELPANLQRAHRDGRLVLQVWGFPWPDESHFGQSLDTEIEVQWDCAPVRPPDCDCNVRPDHPICGLVWSCPGDAACPADAAGSGEAE